MIGMIVGRTKNYTQGIFGYFLQKEANPDVSLFIFSLVNQTLHNFTTN